jgi:hypothetical protein
VILEELSKSDSVFFTDGFDFLHKFINVVQAFEVLGLTEVCTLACWVSGYISFSWVGIAYEV